MNRILMFLFSIWVFSVNAQTEYPAKPIRLIVQFTPGTSTDIIGTEAAAKAPEPVLNKINAEIVRFLGTPDVKERLAGLGVMPIGDTRAQFTAFVRAEIAKWGKLIRDAGVKAD